MNTSLQDKRILLTRPAHQSAGWQALLAEQGAHCDSIPMLEIAPVTPDNQTEAQSIKSLILDFDQFEHAIFVSQNAVRWGFDWLENYWPQLPEGPRFYAIGAATADAIADRGALPERDEARGSMDSEALLALPALQHPEGARVIVFRGQGGRTLIGDTLRERGARVDYCELYQRLLPADAATQLRDYPHTPDAIVVHSGETLENLHQSLQQSHRLTLLGVPLICPSARVAAQARTLGFTRVTAATNAGDTAMLTAMSEALAA
ncbi:uroporphyrinogen-III synthase [Microbulbifer aggregans]|uniref:uroporphyrinogen-III synthase n=1 Tax=Microbulbifer aggregans TaxID=1769779 RepID=UPI001CFED78F|nr:uroporphyrinogen-III synthase [Microbulbifer aggregans]